jgi:hypothetical protein
VSISRARSASISAARSLGALAVDPGQLLAQGLARLEIVGALDLLLEHADQLGVVALGRVELAQAQHRRGVAGLDVEDAAPGGLGGVGQAEALLDQAGEATQQLDALLVVGGDLDAALEHRAQALEVGREREGLVEQRERAAVVGRDLERVAQDRGGAVVVAGVDREVGRLQQQGHAPAGVGLQRRGRLGLQQRLAQVVVEAVLARHAGQLGVEGLERGLRPGLAERPHERVEGVAGAIGALRLEQRRDLAQQLVPRHRVLRLGQLPLVDGDQAHRVLGLLVERTQDRKQAHAVFGAVLDQLLERLHGALEAGLLGEQRLEGVDRGVGVVEPLILQLGDPQEDRLARRAVLGPLEALAQRLDERVPAAEVLVDPLEAVAGDRLIGLGLEHADEGADRQLRVAEDAERELAEAHEHVDLALLVEAGVGLAPVRLGQRLPLLGAGQGLLERREHGVSPGRAWIRRS